jgi:hypothetical protein
MPLSTYGFPWIISILWGLGHLALAYITVDGFLKKRSLRYRITIPSLGVGIPLILLFSGISWLSSETILVWLCFFGELQILPVATYTVILAKQKDLPESTEVTQIFKSLSSSTSRAHVGYPRLILRLHNGVLPNSTDCKIGVYIRGVKILHQTKFFPHSIESRIAQTGSYVHQHASFPELGSGDHTPDNAYPSSNST